MVNRRKDILHFVLISAYARISRAKILYIKSRASDFKNRRFRQKMNAAILHSTCDLEIYNTKSNFLWKIVYQTHK